MRRMIIGAALVMGAGALGCVVREGSGAYTPPPPGATPVYNNAPTQAAANTPPPAPAPAAPAAPVVSPPASSLTTAPVGPHLPATATVAPNGTSTSGVHYVPSMGSLFGNLQSGALKGTLYYIPDTTTQFPDVTKLTPQGTVWANQLAVPMHDFEEGFPGVSKRTDWFAIRYDGTFNATKPGIYTFGLNADDGANLYIDGKMIIDNDGRHLPQEKDGATQLNAGPHSIRVDYFKAMPWVVALQLYCTPPGGQKVYWSQTM